MLPNTSINSISASFNRTKVECKYCKLDSDGLGYFALIELK